MSGDSAAVNSPILQHPQFSGGRRRESGDELDLDSYLREHPLDLPTCLDFIRQVAEFLEKRDLDHTLVEIDKLRRDGVLTIRDVNDGTVTNSSALLYLCTRKEAIQSMKEYCIYLLSKVEPGRLVEHLKSVVQECSTFASFKDEGGVLEIDEMNHSTIEATQWGQNSRDLIRLQLIKYAQRRAIGNIGMAGVSDNGDGSAVKTPAAKRRRRHSSGSTSATLDGHSNGRISTVRSSYNLRARPSEKMAHFVKTVRAEGRQLEEFVWMEATSRKQEFKYLQLLKPCRSDLDCTRGSPYNVLKTGCQYEVCITSQDLPNELGMGVLAMESIPAHKAVFEYTGTILSDKAAEKTQTKHGSRYMYDLDDPEALGYSDSQLPRVIDAYSVGNVSRFLNHSCDPNLRILGTRSFKQHCIEAYQIQRLIFVTLRYITQGEYLTVDYCPRFSTDSAETIRVMEKCRCGAINCRGWLAP